MPICCCFLPSPVACLVVGAVVTFIAIYQLILDYEETTKIGEDEMPVRCVLIAIHVTQAIAGVCALVATMRLLPWLLRGCSFVVGCAGVVYFIEAIFVERRLQTTTLVWASVVIVLYIYMASLLCASANMIEMMLAANPDVIRISRRNPGDPPQQEAGETPERQEGGGRRSAEWYVFVTPLRFPPPAYQPQPPSQATAGGANPYSAPPPTTSHPAAAPAK